MADEHSPNQLLRVLELFKHVTEPLRSFPQGALAQYADTLLCLASESMQAYGKLWRAVAEKDLQYAAFQARNLLELAIWSEYCAKSRDNADRFRQDAVRDLNGMMVAMDHLNAALARMPADWEFAPVGLKDRLKKISALVGVEELDVQYRAVSAAAKELSPETAAAFNKHNTILSKYVHPTALVVNTLITATTADAETLGVFLRVGTSFIGAALVELATAISSLTGKEYPRPFAVWPLGQF